MPQLAAWSALVPFRSIMFAFGAPNRDVTFHYSPDGIAMSSTNMRVHIESNYFDGFDCSAHVVVKLLAADVRDIVQNWGDGEIITLKLDADRRRFVCTYEAEDLSYVREEEFLCLAD